MKAVVVGVAIALLDTAQANGSCPTPHADKMSCDAESDCTWCECGALPSACWSKADAKQLPAGVYSCDGLAGEGPTVLPPIFPTPAEIEKLVCKVASQKMIEDKATSEICTEISKLKNVKIPDCQALVEVAWDKILAKCPKALEVTPAQIEKLVCKVASQKMIEDKATSEICIEISKLKNVKIPDCQALVEIAWDKILAKCPKALEKEIATEDSTCAKPGDCGLAYQACCAGFQAKGFPCGCHLKDGDGKSGGDCGTCGTAYSICCAGFKSKGFPCTCDISSAGQASFVV